MKFSLRTLVIASIGFLIFSVITIIILYLLYFTNLRSYFPPDYVTNSMNVLISTVGLFIAILAFISYIKLEGEIREKKINEENINREIKRKSLIAALQSYDLIREQFHNSIIPNALNTQNFDMVADFINKKTNELENYLNEFIKSCAHLKNVEDIKSEYNALMINLDSYKNYQPNSLKSIQNLIKDLLNLAKSNNVKGEIGKFISDDIIRRIYDLKHNIFMLQTWGKELNITNDGEQKAHLLNNIHLLIEDTYVKNLILYLMLAKSIIIK